ncbi:hypothetical protein CH253_18310 [Rhodococcus sp. 06-156-3C]|nr:hypothetical protein CH248_27510 [Rhodococcus sp. 06-156-4a]OZD18108.1 hypothetical protein CH253_18310 [Rhodococcus sp. 06-156-3C]OZD20720.1 hypothetical protein CH280_03465 [Rhodococcus sp. 06-156-4C]OZD30739.1 hypothetical protein CH247_15260 [Rhodococcus sp. 06-156-3b]OZD32666.1 hypothetical protein CH284_19995 [Rhodococcus sp. 06-156-3]OZF65102.1 hypothetical protein CH290_10585 [Rhodococcus sp. 06-156-4]
MTALLLTGAILTGCSDTRGSDSGSPSTTPSIPAQQWTPGAPDPGAADPTRTPPAAATALPDTAPSVDREDPDSVAAAAVTIWFTWNTGVDAGPNDAAARTAPLLTADYAREITSTTAQSSPGAQWLSWAARGAVLTPTLVVDDELTPPQTDRLAYRAYRVTQNADGQSVGESIVAVVLRRGTSGWEVGRIQRK